MERVKIDVFISDLLYSYDCVIVPEFGGFVANYSSAKLNSIQHKFQPPSKKISFNQQLQNNDGLLTNHIAGKKEINYADAKELIERFVKQSKKELQEGDRIKIEKVGTLYLDAEKNIQFIAENSTNYLPDSFGLEAFRALPIEREKIENRIAEKIKQSPVIIKEKLNDSDQKKKVHWIPAAAILAFLILSGFIINLQFNLIDSSGINYSSFRFNASEKPLYQHKEMHIDPIAFEEDIVSKELWFPADSISRFISSNEEKTALFVDNRIEKIEPREVKKDNTRVENNSGTSNIGLKFHVVAGCFTQTTNAYKLLDQLTLKGYDAVFLGSYKKYQAVSIGSFNSREEALNLLREVRNQDHPNAWLLVKSY